MSVLVPSKTVLGTRATLYVPRTVLDGTRTDIFARVTRETGWFYSKCVQPNAYQYYRYIPKRDVGHPGKGQIIQNNLKHNLGRFSCTFQSASFEIPKIPLVSLGHADLTLFKLTVKERWPNYQKCHFTSNCEWQFPRVGPSFHPSF